MSKAVTFQFAPNKIRGVALFAAKSDIRYYLNGVFFTRAPNGKGMIAVATDGHRLTVIYHEQDISQIPEDFAGVIVPTAELLMAAKAPIKGDAGTLDVVCIVVGPKVTLRSSIQVECAAVEGKFTDYQRVVPKMKGRRHSGYATVQAGYLADYAKLSALLKPGARSDYHEITVSSTDQNSSVVVGIGVPECVCILMPMRGSAESDLADRDWLSSKASA